MYNVNNFIQILGEICNNFVENLQIGRKFDSNREKIFYSCWKAWSVLLILRFNEVRFLVVFPPVQYDLGCLRRKEGGRQG